MTTALFTHPSGGDHHNPPGHPEQVARYQVVLDALAGLDLDHQTAPEIADVDLLRCHPQSYLDMIRASSPAQGFAMLDGDTSMSPGTLNAALHAAGGAVAAVDAVLSGQAANAYLAMRPPGHHAETSRAMGFCLFGNAAIAAKYALDHHGLDRVALLDFDVHHGNGTQDLLWSENRIFFASTHQMPLFPGTGAASETGAHGQMMNVPLAPNSGGAEARAAWTGILAEMLRFDPQLVIVSAGFDAHHDDPLAQLRWTDQDFAAITQAICAAAKTCQAPVVSVQEGGYDLPALGRAVRAHVETLIEAGR